MHAVRYKRRYASAVDILRVEAIFEKVSNGDASIEVMIIFLVNNTV